MGAVRSARFHFRRGGVAIIGAHVKIRAVRGQQADDIGMPLGRRPHQGRLPAEVFLRVHFGAMLEQNFHRFHIAIARRFHQNRLGLRGDQGVGIRAGLEQLLNQRSPADAHGFGQRRSAITIERGYVRAGRQQRVYSFQVAPVRRPMQRRGAVSFRAFTSTCCFKRARADSVS